MLKKVLFYYNPTAGNKILSSKLDSIAKKFQEKGQYLVPVRSKKSDNLKKLISKKEVESAGYAKIVVGGGDGTINRVVNAMLKNDINVPLAILPFGTANDYAKNFAIPKNIEKMLDVATSEKSELVDIGKANDEYFINVFAVGMLASLSQRTNANAKNTFGPLAYYAQGLAELPRLKSIYVRIKSKEKIFEERIMFMLVMNGQSAGGFQRLGVKAKVNDSVLDIVLFKDMPFYEFPGTFVNVLVGDHYKNKNIIYWQTDELSIEAPYVRNPVVTDVDGEHGGELPTKITLLPKKLRVVTRQEIVTSKTG